MAMKRNLDNQESKRHWEFVEDTSRRVNAWPEWKRLDVEPRRGVEQKPADSSRAEPRRPTQHSAD